MAESAFVDLHVPMSTSLWTAVGLAAASSGVARGAFCRRLLETWARESILTTPPAAGALPREARVRVPLKAETLRALRMHAADINWRTTALAYAVLVARCPSPIDVLVHHVEQP